MWHDVIVSVIKTRSPTWNLIVLFIIISIIIIIIYSLTARVVRAPQMISQPVFSVFPCSPLPSGTCRTPGLSIPWRCLPTSSSVCLVFFPLSLFLARWFWPDLMNGRRDHTSTVCVSLWSSWGLRVVHSLLDLGTDFLVGRKVSRPFALRRWTLTRQALSHR